MGSAWMQNIDRGNREHLIEMARRDLAERESISPTSDQITEKSVTPVVWLDMAMGYPQPGRKVAPGYVPGFQIILNYGGRDYDYHTGFGRVVYVPPGKGQPPLPADAM